MPIMNDLQKQQNILRARNDFMSWCDDAKNQMVAEERAFKYMKEASPAQLQPCLVQRNNSDFIAAYLVQKVGSGGWRVLVTGSRWVINRVKKSALILSIPKNLTDRFNQAVFAQGVYFGHIANLTQALIDRRKHESRKGVHAGQAGNEKIRSGLCKGRKAKLKRQA